MLLVILQKPMMILLMLTYITFKIMIQSTMKELLILPKQMLILYKFVLILKMEIKIMLLVILQKPMMILRKI